MRSRKAVAATTATRSDALSRNEALVLAALREANVPLGAYDLVRSLQASGLNTPISVYRALDRLMRRRLVHRIESIAGFVACDHSCHEGSAAFVLCEQCGRVAELADTDIAAHLDASAQRIGFVVARASVELHGTCATCAGRQDGC